MGNIRFKMISTTMDVTCIYPQNHRIQHNDCSSHRVCRRKFSPLLRYPFFNECRVSPTVGVTKRVHSQYPCFMHCIPCHGYVHASHTPGWFFNALPHYHLTLWPFSIYTYLCVFFLVLTTVCHAIHAACKPKTQKSDLLGRPLNGGTYVSR